MNAPGREIHCAFAENLARIEAEIAAACARSGRARSEVALMAVSKTHTVPAILDAASHGITMFGESRVQEFQQKRDQLLKSGYLLKDANSRTPEEGQTPPHRLNAEFHLIGHLQSNKASRAAELFSSIDSVDSLRLAERLNDAALRLGRRLPVLLEIKLSAEEEKTGLLPGSAELSALLERLPDLSALDPQGMMTIPPYNDDPEQARPYFARLRDLRGQLAASHPHLALSGLSMGMSHDFAVAIEEGSTQVRIGTALFGDRAADTRP